MASKREYIEQLKDAISKQLLEQMETGDDPKSPKAAAIAQAIRWVEKLERDEGLVSNDQLAAQAAATSARMREINAPPADPANMPDDEATRDW